MRKPVMMLGRSILSGKNIAYEVTSLAPHQSLQVVQQWLSGAAHDERMARWRQLGASLCSDCLYFVDKQQEAIGLKSVQHFVDMIISKTATHKKEMQEPHWILYHQKLLADFAGLKKFRADMLSDNGAQAAYIDQVVRLGVVVEGVKRKLIRRLRDRKRPK